MRPVSVCARVCSACVRVTVLMRVCGCVRAWVRVCLGLASRTPQTVGRLDAPFVCLCARVCSACVLCMSFCATRLASCREVLYMRKEEP
eukprot:SAG25_NODE_187_length_12399_cov_42.588537_9_plen_89_part_00